MDMEVIQTKVFEKVISALLNEEEYRQLEATLVQNPGIGAIIPDSGGIRKMRWKRQGKGKRGGIRVIYYWMTSSFQILMLYAYSKSKQEDLSRNEIKVLKQLVEEEMRYGRKNV